MNYNLFLVIMSMLNIPVIIIACDLPEKFPHSIVSRVDYEEFDEQQEGFFGLSTTTQEAVSDLEDELEALSKSSPVSSFQQSGESQTHDGRTVDQITSSDSSDAQPADVNKQLNNATAVQERVQQLSEQRRALSESNLADLYYQASVLYEESDDDDEFVDDLFNHFSQDLNFKKCVVQISYDRTFLNKKYTRQDIANLVKVYVRKQKLELQYPSLEEWYLVKIENEIQNRLSDHAANALQKILKMQQQEQEHRKQSLPVVVAALRKELQNDPEFIGPEKDMAVDTYVLLYLKQSQNPRIKELFNIFAQNADKQKLVDELSIVLNKPKKNTVSSLTDELISRTGCQQNQLRGFIQGELESRLRDRQEACDKQRKKQLLNSKRKKLL